MTASVVFRLSIVLSQKIYAPRLELLMLPWRDSMSDIAIIVLPFPGLPWIQSTFEQLLLIHSI